jgi:hypothetical protein
MPTYRVHTKRFGTVRKEADRIADARAWADGLERGATVTREFNNPPCEDCDCRPCCCERRGREHDA